MLGLYLASQNAPLISSCKSPAILCVNVCADRDQVVGWLAYPGWWWYVITTFRIAGGFIAERLQKIFLIHCTSLAKTTSNQPTKIFCVYLHVIAFLAICRNDALHLTFSTWSLFFLCFLAHISWNLFSIPSIGTSIAFSAGPGSRQPYTKS